MKRSGVGWASRWALAVAAAVTLVPATGSALSSRVLIAPTGEAAGDHFGFSVAGVGDFNGDGFPDVLVGAFANDAGGADAGRAYLYYGGPLADTVADLTLTGHEPGEEFGFSVAGAGDLNGDGYPDLIVGTRYAKRAYVYFGGPAADSVADLVLAGFGDRAVAGAGDFNCDGYGDVIVGALGTDSAYVYYGGPGVDDLPDRILTSQRGENGQVSFGFAVGTAGDVNLDGCADILVGAPREGGLGPTPGIAYLFYGGAPPDTVADLILGTTEFNTDYGSAVATGGDLNGDGSADPVIGTNSSYGPGEARVYLGRPISGEADLVLTGEMEYDHFGRSVGTAGDVNADGYSDLVVGAFGNDAGGTNAGRVYVFLGGAVVDAVPDLVLTGETASGNLGWSVATAGDVNGDGFADIVIGAPGVYTAGEYAGRAFVVRISPVPLGVGPARGVGAVTRVLPNPARGRVSLELELAAPGEVTAEVYDTGGRRVGTIAEREALPMGRTVLGWEPQGLGAGLYLVRIRVAGRQETRKLVWLGQR